MRTLTKTTLLDLIQTVSEYAKSDTEIVATVAYLVNSGKVQLCGNFAGAKIDLSTSAYAASSRRWHTIRHWEGGIGTAGGERNPTLPRGVRVSRGGDPLTPLLIKYTQGRRQNRAEKALQFQNQEGGRPINTILCPYFF